MALYGWRATGVASEGRFALLSRESLLLTNNVLLTVAASTVLLGTLYPLILDALGAGKVSVGTPYFNGVFVPLMVPLALLLGIGPLARWKREQIAPLAGRLRAALVFCVVGGTGLALLVSATAALQLGLASRPVLALLVATTVGRLAAGRAGANGPLRAGGQFRYGNHRDSKKGRCLENQYDPAACHRLAPGQLARPRPSRQVSQAVGGNS